MSRTEEPFRALTASIWKAFPDTPPCTGAYADIIPHLTIADRLSSDAEHAQITNEFLRTAHDRLPVGATCSEITMMDSQSGRWEIRRRFSVGRRETR